MKLFDTEQVIIYEMSFSKFGRHFLFAQENQFSNFSSHKTINNAFLENINLI